MMTYTLRLSACAALLLTGCATGNKVSISHGKVAAVQTKSRSEPIFYNGKTYQLDYSYAESSASFDMRVSGMGPQQQKDAVAVATSGLRYYACLDGQNGRMAGQPSYAGGVWSLQARCA
jgi:hypothetical protein